MCNNGTCGQHPGEAEFQTYLRKLAPNEVIFGEQGQTESVRYGVVVNSCLCQWEIVAVENGHNRHVAFVGPEFGLSRALNMADRWTQSRACLVH